MTSLTSDMIQAKPNPQRLLLSILRKGDHAHPGDVAALEIILHHLKILKPDIQASAVLDIGCGFGGTVQYLRDHGFRHVKGIDVNEESIKYAIQKYGPWFQVRDTYTLRESFPKQKFDLFLFLSSLYAMQDKETVIKKVTAISSPGAILVLFDYSIASNTEILEIKDFSGKPMFPLHIKTISKYLKENGWVIITVEDMSDKFIFWYVQLLEKLLQEHTTLETQFSDATLTSVHQTFSYLLHQLQNKKIGGVLIYAKKI